MQTQIKNSIQNILDGYSEQKDHSFYDEIFLETAVHKYCPSTLPKRYTNYPGTNLLIMVSLMQETNKKPKFLLKVNSEI